MYMVGAIVLKRLALGVLTLICRIPPDIRIRKCPAW